jgi:hypothetical protein
MSSPTFNLWVGILTYLGEFIISPMGQLLFWGVLTSLVFLYTLIRCLNSDEDAEDSNWWRMIAAGVMIVFWCINATTWVMGSMGIVVGAMKWLYLSDLFFFALSGIMWGTHHYRWMGKLTILYAAAFFTTVSTWYGYLGVVTVYGEQVSLCNVVNNVIYLLQLFTVSGWLQSESKDHSHGTDISRLSLDLFGEPDLR